MATNHIKSIGAGLFSDLSVATDDDGVTAVDTSGMTAAQIKSAFDLKFPASGELSASSEAAVTGSKFIRIKNVREFPAMGTPPNIVNVPTYGQKTTQQIQGQSDAPNIEIQLNFIASDWAAETVLGKMVGDGKTRAFRFALLNSEPNGLEGFASSVAGLGSVENSYWYWNGKIEALMVTPSLTDANTATVTLTLQSKLYGAYSLA